MICISTDTFAAIPRNQIRGHRPINGQCRGARGTERQPWHQSGGAVARALAGNDE